MSLRCHSIPPSRWAFAQGFLANSGFDWLKVVPLSLSRRIVNGGELDSTSLVQRVLAVLPFAKFARHALHSPDLLPRRLA